MIVRDLVVERLAVQVDKVGEELDIVATARRHAVELGERADRVGVRGRDHVGLGQHFLDELLGRVHVRVAARARRRNVKSGSWKILLN